MQDEFQSLQLASNIIAKDLFVPYYLFIFAIKNHNPSI